MTLTIVLSLAGCLLLFLGIWGVTVTMPTRLLAKNFPEDVQAALKTRLDGLDRQGMSPNRDKDVTPETLIPIERIQAPVLMLSSKHDEVWPSYESAIYMEQRLTDIVFHYPHKHVAYEHMSHAVITKLPWIYKMAFKPERQHPKDCAEDRERLKTELLNWVHSEWP